MKFFSTLFLLFLLISCDDENYIYIEQFNYTEGQTFSYEYTFSLSQNDSVFDTQKSTYKLEVVSTNASVGNFRNLIKFKVYDIESPEFYTHSWYQQTEDGFFDIAYKNAGVDPGIQPKEKNRKNRIKPSFLLPYFEFNNSHDPNYKDVVDSLIIRDEIRLTVPFPLHLETKEWTEFSNVFLRKSRTTDITTVHNKEALKVTSTFEGVFNIDIEFNSYFTNSGLIKRTIYVKDQPYFGEDSNGIIGRFDTFQEIILKK